MLSVVILVLAGAIGLWGAAVAAGISAPVALGIGAGAVACFVGADLALSVKRTADNSRESVRLLTEQTEILRNLGRPTDAHGNDVSARGALRDLGANN